MREVRCFGYLSWHFYVLNSVVEALTKVTIKKKRGRKLYILKKERRSQRRKNSSLHLKTDEDCVDV